MSGLAAVRWHGSVLESLVDVGDGWWESTKEGRRCRSGSLKLRLERRGRGQSNNRGYAPGADLHFESVQSVRPPPAPPAGSRASAVASESVVLSSARDFVRYADRRQTRSSRIDELSGDHWRSSVDLMIVSGHHHGSLSLLRPSRLHRQYR